MKKLKELYLDFEFNRVVEPRVNLVSVACLDEEADEVTSFWLHNSPRVVKEFKEFLRGYDHFIAYSVVAEARSFISLGIEPLDKLWTDLFIEYRMMTNHNHRLQYGKQLVKGKVKNTFPPKPKWERTEEDKGEGFKATHSLAEATYKLLGVVRDTAHKEETRNLIISDPEEFAARERKQILAYGEDDVRDLPGIRRELEKEFSRLRPGYDMKQYRREARERGRYAAHTAWMETNGYPISVKKTRNFSSQIPNIMYELQRDINSQFPEIKPFKWVHRTQKFSWNQKATREWIKANEDVDAWMKTEKKQISLSLEAFERFYSYKHDYPRGNFGAQMVRFLKLKQSVYGFSEAKEDSDKRTFWDYVGSDGRVRPYMNPFAAQSSRTQPASSGFLFLKPAWMRALLVPPKGKFCCGIDYGSEEFFLSGLRSRDANMIQAYLSGDPYLAFGKTSGQIPRHGTKETHKAQRDACKSTVLGISYLMTRIGLAIKLTADTGRKWSEDEAQEQIDLFNDTFADYYDYQQDLMDSYQEQGFLALPCGWHLWGDNDNHRSFTNADIQGTGASIMRKAVDLYYEKTGEKIMFTLHDALYIEGDQGREKELIIALRDAMREAFVFYAPQGLKDVASQIRLDPFAWGRHFPKEGEIKLGDMKVPVGRLYIDERSLVDYNKFKQYFEDRPEDKL